MDEKPFKCPKHPNLPGYKDRRGLLQHFKNKHTPKETQEPDMKKALEVQNTKVPCSKGCGKRLDYHYVKTHELKCHPASQSEPRPSSNISSRAQLQLFAFTLHIYSGQLLFTSRAGRHQLQKN